MCVSLYPLPAGNLLYVCVCSYFFLVFPGSVFRYFCCKGKAIPSIVTRAKL